jgi:DNA-binding beta-propeller fold protein YncE
MAALLSTLVLASGCGTKQDTMLQDMLTLSVLNQAHHMMDGTYIYVADGTGLEFDALVHDHMTHSISALSPTATSVTPGSMVATANNHIYVVLSGENSVGVYDGNVQPPTLLKKIHTGLGSTHIYEDGGSIWVMNDGDKASKLADGVTANPNYGIDTDKLYKDCAASSKSSVTVIQDGAASASAANAATFVAKICVGRGHHKAAFAPNYKKVYVSSTIAGSLDVIDNNPASGTHLTVTHTIDTCDATFGVQIAADATCAATGNLDKSSPHGIDYSPVTGMIYNANSGYGNVLKINPATDGVVATINPGFSNTLHVTHDGNFAITKAMDSVTVTPGSTNKTAKITVIKLADDSFVTTDIQDAAPDMFMQSPDETKLYVVTTQGFYGGAGLDTNLKSSLFVFDATALPNLTQIAEIPVGNSTQPHRQFAMVAHGTFLMHILVPNYDDGTVTVIDAMDNTVHSTMATGGNPTAMMTFEPGVGGHGH